MHTVKDRLGQNYIPCLGQTRAKLYALFRTERTKTIPCPAAHPRLSHIREYPPGAKSIVLILQTLELAGKNRRHYLAEERLWSELRPCYGLEAILTRRQEREKQQCLYENLTSNNYPKTIVQKKYEF